MRRVPSGSLFQTAQFRESAFIAELCEAIGDVWVTDDAAWGRHGHFTTYFGVIVLRAGYRDLVFHDLYVLHELWHRRTIRYQRGRSWLQWSRDLIASELDASLTSECLVYFHIPGLRARTFAHEIWVDRFLAAWSSRPIAQVAFHLQQERLRALSAPAFDDFLEHQIANYGRQNMLWARVWAGAVGVGPTPDDPAFRVVDRHLSSPDWASRHPEWIAAHSDGAGLPFAAQAAAFQPIYERSQREFGNEVLSR
jgi:hypothetical protein